jgi:hypothetical protein
MSALPRSYWTSLFNLEAIKARNKPKMPPAPVPTAPFFLPTVVRGGATPSFPTPQEYAELTNSLAQEKETERDAQVARSNDEEQASSSSSGGGSSQKKRDAATAIASSSSSAKKLKPTATGSGHSDGDEEARIVAELAALGGAWTDEPDDDWALEDAEAAAAELDLDKSSGQEKSKNKSKSPGSAAAWFTQPGSMLKDGDEADEADDAGEVVAVEAVMSRRPSSHLINRKTALPR